MRAGLLLLVPCVLAGCLPDDTRPPPAELTITASSSELTLGGIPSAATADGYQIFFERFLVDLGEETLGSDGDASCNEYSNPGYTRAFDFEQVSSPTELGIAFATGRCTFGFSVQSPNESSLAGHGLAPGDLDFMRTAGSDHDAANAGISVYVEGEAVRGEQVEHFAWPFRKRVQYDTCYLTDATTGEKQPLELTSGEHTSVNVEIHAEALFQGVPTDLLHFEPYAEADANGDGEITFDELWGVPAFDGNALYVSPIDPVTHEPARPCYTREGDVIDITSLGDYAYCELLPKVARFEGNDSCMTVSGRQPSD